MPLISIIRSHSRCRGWRLQLGIATLLCVLPSPVRAQDGAAGHETRVEEEAPPRWSFAWDANAFAGWNYQRREFTDFQEIESQNWVMGMAQRPIGAGRLRFDAGLSFEPFTIQPLGSPQVFQTGETFRRAPLVDYQHPHDLIMALGAAYDRPIGAATAFVELSLVGSPSIGPPPFMHRPSASENPTVPLGHHMMDSTHITAGVVKAGVERGGARFEGSWFRGLEPDENRTDLDLGRLDSWAARASWRRGAWDAQVSAAHLTTPEWLEPFTDMTKLSASIGVSRADGRLAALAAWGQNREVHGILDAYLLEATARPRTRDALYTRLEWTTKNILSVGGRHPPGFRHFHPLSKVGALTLGYVRDLRIARDGRYGIGADATVYRVPPNLRDNYGTAPLSFHLFLRYRPVRAAPHVH